MWRWTPSLSFNKGPGHKNIHSTVQGTSSDLTAIIMTGSMCIPRWSKFSGQLGCAGSELLAGGRHTCENQGLSEGAMDVPSLGITPF